MAEEKKQDPRTCKLLVRLSFTDGLKDKKAPVRDGKEKHSCNLIVVQTADDADPISKQAAALFDAQQQRILACIKAAGDAQWGKPEAFKGIAENDPKRLCFRKGERFKNDEDEVYKGYAGNWGISCSGPGGGQRRPKMWDRFKRPFRGNASGDEIKNGQFFDVEEILNVCYSGCYADVIVSFYGTDEGGKGIFCSVEAIRSRQEGPQIGGGIQTSADDFEDLDGGDAFEGTSAGASSTGSSSTDSDFG
jgi:hypothetical protein